MIAISLAPDPMEDAWASDATEAARRFIAWWSQSQQRVSIQQVRRAMDAAVEVGSAVRFRALRGVDGVLFLAVSDYLGGTLRFDLSDVAREVDQFVEMLLVDDIAAPSRRIAEEAWTLVARAQAGRERAR